MGFTPADVRGMTLWEFGHAVAGWSEANGGKTSHDPTPDELAELDALMNSAPETLH